MGINRRSFLIGSSGTLGAVALPIAVKAQSGEGANLRETIIPDAGWRAWPDTAAPWQDDPIYLPDEVDLARLRSSAPTPTGGWEILGEETGRAITLPASIEQFWWGKLGERPYTYQEYEHTAYDEVQNGAYHGVSWFWRTFEAPPRRNGQRVRLRIRGARQRIEVFVNRQLVGYDLIAETAYECDITDALAQGDNQLAVRITNPGGIYDWRDFEKITWGKQQFHAGRGFGGLDRGLSLRVVDPLRIADAWVLNRPEGDSVDVHVSLVNESDGKAVIAFDVSATPQSGGGIIGKAKRRASVGPGERTTIVIPLKCAGAMRWSPETPALNIARIACASNMGEDERAVTFGLRWFEADDIGRNAVFRLDGKRRRLYSAIEFGYWGFNGLWPTTELATKSVASAKTLGLNSLMYHRNLGKTQSLEEDDRLGLMRYMECGGGLFCYQNDKTGTNEATNAPPTQGPIDTSGKVPGERPWAERYQLFRLERMMRDHRSHPSVVVWCLQNESVPDLHNPKIFDALRRMRALDPSRPIILHSGIEPRNQVFFLPYDDTAHVENGTGYSGWSDTHTVGGPGVWQDAMYRSPDYFAHRDTNRTEISVLGEMLGWGAPDNHALTLASIARGGGESYEKALHEKVLAAYEAYLAKWGFREAFPNAAAMLRDVGDKLFESWVRILRIARTCDTTDQFVINGWEDQPIDSHSGFLDNQRNFKGDPVIVRAVLAGVLPVVQTRQCVLQAGERPVLDLFHIDERLRTKGGAIELSHVAPDGTRQVLGKHALPAMGEEVFAALVTRDLAGPQMLREGYHELHAAITDAGTHSHSTRLFVIEPAHATLAGVSLGIVGDPAVFAAMTPNSRFTAAAFERTRGCDVIVATRFETDRGIDLTGIVRAVRAGTPLLVLAQSASDAHRWSRLLAGLGALEYAGMVGDNRGCWMGNWTFARRHSIYEGLPVDQVMKWEYQVAHDDASGAMVEGRGVEVIAGYGRDHDDTMGAATYSARLDKTPIVVQCIRRMQPLVYERFINNAVRFLSKRQ